MIAALALAALALAAPPKPHVVFSRPRSPLSLVRFATLCRVRGLRLAECLELGDVRLVVLRDVRNAEPVAMEERARKLLDAR